VDGYDALLFLGDSNTRHLFQATLAQLAGDTRKGLCPASPPYWHDELGQALNRVNPAAHFTASSPEAEVVAAICEYCYGGNAPRGAGGASKPDPTSRPCQSYIPFDHTQVTPAQRPCGGKLAFHYIDCGPCGPKAGESNGPVHKLLELAAQYRNPLFLIGFGIHNNFNGTAVSHNLAPLLARLNRHADADAAAGLGRQLRLVWVEPLAREERMVPEQYIRLGQNATSASRMAFIMDVTLRHLGSALATLSGSAVSPAMGAITPDGTHMVFSANLVRASVLLQGIEFRRHRQLHHN
jgi:hypothetical protein